MDGGDRTGSDWAGRTLAFAFKEKTQHGEPRRQQAISETWRLSPNATDIPFRMPTNNGHIILDDR
jgi:hypothetical protein